VATYHKETDMEATKELKVTEMISVIMQAGNIPQQFPVQAFKQFEKNPCLY
jgi:hypothetical protein